MLKSILKSIYISLFIAFAINCVSMIAVDLAHDGTIRLTDYELTKSMLSLIGIGLGFGLPSVIYSCERMPYIMRSIIHMGIGCTILLATAFARGWIPVQAGPIAVTLTIGIILAEALVIWLCFAIHYKKEAARINERLKNRRENSPE